MTAPISLSLDAVIATVTDEEPRLLAVERAGTWAIPTGLLDPEHDRKLEAGLRRWVASQTGLDVGYVEQLYTFGDLHRRREPAAPRHLSVAYLALVAEAQPSPGAAWLDWYEVFPWEDHRGGPPQVLTDHLAPALDAWAHGDSGREGRVAITFAGDSVWDPIRALERYELLYEARLVSEVFRDDGRVPPAGLHGRELAYDHRRVVATAIGRLRGKLTYRPVVFEVMPDTFTLTGLQRTVEALSGVRIHKQNFRRLVERGQLVEGTGETAASTGGRPAELFRFRQEVVSERPRPGMRLPGMRT